MKKNFCALLDRVKTYTHTKNLTCIFTGSHLRAVTDDDDDDDDDNDDDDNVVTGHTDNSFSQLDNTHFCGR